MLLAHYQMFCPKTFRGLFPGFLQKDEFHKVINLRIHFKQIFPDSLQCSVLSKTFPHASRPCLRHHAIYHVGRIWGIPGLIHYWTVWGVSWNPLIFHIGIDSIQICCVVEKFIQILSKTQWTEGAPRRQREGAAAVPAADDQHVGNRCSYGRRRWDDHLQSPTQPTLQQNVFDKSWELNHTMSEVDKKGQTGAAVGKRGGPTASSCLGRVLFQKSVKHQQTAASR